MADKLASFDFSTLVAAIRQTLEYMAAQAGRAVNISLTLRNWVIGCYIREYEQNVADRAEYGTQVLEHLGRELQKSLDRCYTARYLRLCRQLYATYPQIRKSLISKFGRPGKGKPAISELPALPEADDPMKLVIVRDMWLTGFDYASLLQAEPAKRIAGIAAAIEHILQLEDRKKRYLAEVTALSKAFALAAPHEQALRIRDEVGFFQEVRAQIRVIVKRILRKYGYPPDKQEKATQTVLEQAEVLCKEWVL